MNILVTGDPGGCPLSASLEVRDLKSIAQSGLKARKLCQRLSPLPLRFKVGRQFASGCLLAADHQDGKIPFEQHLEEKYLT